ncbi:MAG: hypothetical protein JWO22_3518 [Frankiales bacterium]|nr:hypothetical protein [Frankiales bacterium]
MTRSRTALLAATATAVSITGCSGLEFRQDRRLSFTSPKADALTTVPVKLSWSMKDYATGPDSAQYAVFVDTAPIKVGQTVRSLVPPNTAAGSVEPLLNAKNIYRTPATSIILKSIPDIAYDTDKRQRHTVTIVLLDASGKRESESAWTRSFDLHAINNGGTS